jgi:hypothetical protein
MPLFANSSELIMKKSSTLICAALSGLLMAAPALADQKLEEVLAS